MSELSKYSQFDFPSRISARGVVFGATISLVLFTVFLSLGGGLGLLPAGPLDASAIREAGAGLVVWGTISWMAAAFIGAMVSAMNARATGRGDGFLHGIATWAVACATGGVLSCVWLMSAISMDLVARDVTFALWGRTGFWTFFVADVLALGSALLGGNVAARLATKLSGRIEVTREEPTPMVRRPAPQPT